MNPVAMNDAGAAQTIIQLAPGVCAIARQTKRRSSPRVSTVGVFILIYRACVLVRSKQLRAAANNRHYRIVDHHYLSAGRFSFGRRGQRLSGCDVNDLRSPAPRRISLEREGVRAAGAGEQINECNRHRGATATSQAHDLDRGWRPACRDRSARLARAT